MKSFFAPDGCAIVGASRDAAKPGHQMLISMLDAGFPSSTLYPVNPGETEVAGLRAFPDLVSIPGRVELAVLMVPPRALEAVLADVKRRRRDRGDLAGVIVTAGGYAELGTAEGANRQDRLVASIREAGVRLMGPNCIGVIDTASHLDTTFLHGVVRAPGPLAFISQSGAVGAWFLQMLSAEPRPVGFSKFVSLGNMADVSMAETLDYLRMDPATGVVGVYLEGVARPRKLLASLAALASEKPVVALKTGRSAAGSAAATSHTGALAGSDRIWDGALRQAGVLRVDRMEELVDTLRLLAGNAIPLAESPGPEAREATVRSLPLRTFVVTHAGGPGVYTMDLLAGHSRHITPARVSQATRDALSAAVPPMSSVCRPEGHVDMTASATPAQHAEVVKLVLGDPGVDALITLDLPIRFLGEEVVARSLAEGWAAAGEMRRSERQGKIFLPVIMHGKWSEAGRRLLSEAGLCALPGPDRAVAALLNLARHARLAVFRGTEEPLRPDDGGAVPVSEAATVLNEVESAELLRTRGVGFAPSRLCSGKKEVLDAARELGYPVVLKLCSRAIPHKMAAGAVRLDLRTEEEVGRAYDDLSGAAQAVLEAGKALDGYLVQAQAERGLEVIVGGLRDSLFGPVAALGLGGSGVGTRGSLSFRLAPLSGASVREFVASFLEDALADPRRDLDVEALEFLVQAMSGLLVDRPDVLEVDLNPVLLYRRGRGALAVDALARVAIEP